MVSFFHVSRPLKNAFADVPAQKAGRRVKCEK